MTKKGVNYERRDKGALKLSLYELMIGDLEQKWQDLRNKIYEVSSEIAKIIEEEGGNPGVPEIVQGLRAYPYYYNPPELKELAERDTRIKELYLQKLSLEEELKRIEWRIRTL